MFGGVRGCSELDLLCYVIAVRSSACFVYCKCKSCDGLNDILARTVDKDLVLL